MIPEVLDPVEWESIVNSLDREFGQGITKKLLGKLTPISLVDRNTSYPPHG